MKLYFSPGACSMASHIALLETGLPFKAEKVDLRSKVTASGANFNTINPKGYVPALETQTGEMLTEGAAILQYIADRVPEKDLAPRQGTFERYQLQEWLTYISSEVHKTYSALFNPKITEEARVATIDKLHKRLEFIDQSLTSRPFLMGSNFSVADAYLFTVVGWSPMLKVDISRHHKILGFIEKVQNRPAVQAALKAEGLK